MMIPVWILLKTALNRLSLVSADIDGLSGCGSFVRDIFYHFPFFHCDVVSTSVNSSIVLGMLLGIIILKRNLGKCNFSQISAQKKKLQKPL